MIFKPARAAVEKREVDVFKIFCGDVVCWVGDKNVYGSLGIHL